MNRELQPITQVGSDVASTGQPFPTVQCWKDEGVFGNSTCPELQKVVHCRNCAAYSRAAAQVLGASLPVGYREQWARELSLPQKTPQVTGGSVILFRVGQEWLALATRCFQEISERRSIHSLPHQPPFVLGLANVRGELVTCISLAHFLGLGQVPNLNTLRTNYHRLLVVSWAGCRLGFPVQEVQGPRRFSQNELKPLPTSVSNHDSGLTNCVLNSESKAVGMLDANLLCTAFSRSLK